MTRTLIGDDKDTHKDKAVYQQYPQLTVTPHQPLLISQKSLQSLREDIDRTTTSEI